MTTSEPEIPLTATSRRGHTRALSVAPMMDYTDRHCRVVMRALTRETLLYSEMITAQAIVLGGRVDLIAKDPTEHPVALQLGGDDPRMLARAAKIAEDLGWDEINLNVGCPSDRVQRGRFGACLMAVPDVVAECVAAMRGAVSIPVTVKHRIGIDERDAYEDMFAFVEVVARAGADRFSVHARKAWLSGLSPRENRTIPPLRYDEVYRLKRERPELAIEINGGIKTLGDAKTHLEHVDAVMIGRAACDDPWVFAEADTRIFGAARNPAETRSEAALAVVPYLAREVARGTKPHAVTRHLLGLFARTPLAKAWKHGIASIGQMKDAEALRAPAALEALALAASRPREERLARAPGPHT